MSKVYWGTRLYTILGIVSWCLFALIYILLKEESLNFNEWIVAAGVSFILLEKSLNKNKGFGRNKAVLDEKGIEIFNYRSVIINKKFVEYSELKNFGEVSKTLLGDYKLKLATVSKPILLSGFSEDVLTNIVEELNKRMRKAK